MIKEKCFSREWLESFKNQKEHKMIQTNILEKMIYALHLLEGLKSNGLDFVFKGGTSLVLLLEEGNRFSIDLDIICKVDRNGLENILDEIVKNSHFSSVILDKKRSYKPGIPKAHYIFEYKTVFNTKAPGKILLDILVEDSIYPEHVETAVQTKWIETDSTIMVKTPSVDSIVGDKLTAFAPNTIGIPYFKREESFSMEIIKQLFDLSRLFDKISRFETVSRSFQAHVKQEIHYEKNKNRGRALIPAEVLHDIIETCLIITKKNSNVDIQDKRDFKLLQDGIKAFGSGYLMSGNFRIDDAVLASSKVAYVASKLLFGDLNPIKYYSGEDINSLDIQLRNMNYIYRLKKQPDKSAFYYWFRALDLITADYHWLLK